LEKTQDSDKINIDELQRKQAEALIDAEVEKIIPYNRTTEEILTDIWHNQATIIKWLSKIAENTK